MIACTLIATGSIDASTFCEISLEVEPSSTRAEVGQPIALRASLRNTSDTPCFVELDADLAENAWSAQASCGESRLKSQTLHFDQSLEDLRFQYVALTPGREVSFELPAINDLSPVSMMDIPSSGECSVVVTFASQGERVEGLVWPIWRGRLEAATIRLDLSVPSSDSLARMISRLSACVAGPCREDEVFYYFRIVRSRSAVPLLRQLIPNMLLEHPAFAEAVANQGDPESLDLMEQAARRDDMDERTQAYLLELVRTARQASVIP